MSASSLWEDEASAMVVGWGSGWGGEGSDGGSVTGGSELVRTDDSTKISPELTCEGKSALSASTTEASLATGVPLRVVPAILVVAASERVKPGASISFSGAISVSTLTDSIKVWSVASSFRLAVVVVVSTGLLAQEGTCASVLCPALLLRAFPLLSALAVEILDAEDNAVLLVSRGLGAARDATISKSRTQIE